MTIWFQIFSLLLCFVFSSSVSSTINDETSSLLSFKLSLQNPSALSSWNDSSPHCHWLGVTCHHGRVNSLILSSMSLQSTELSPSLFTFPNLTTLVLSNNSLSGNLPSGLNESSLPRLLYLDLSINNFSGSLPPSFFLTLPSLSSLDLSNNSFSGQIPGEIGKLYNLSDLYIGHNRFSGLIPPEIGELSSLKSLVAPYCFFNGPLPDEFSKLKALARLDFSYNPLKCSIPRSIGKLENLTMLNLVSSQLYGVIPPEIGMCKRLKMLMLSFNDLSGSLPFELSEVPLMTFSAEGNRLSGEIPSWIGKWKEIESLLLDSNKFTGQIPREIEDCPMLKTLSLVRNLLNGSIPREICGSGALEYIDLSLNYLEGSIEEVFVGCKNLLQLTLVNNTFNGSIPEYLSELPLLALDLDYNNFTGALPVSLWKSENLMEFSASNNRLGGYLPAEIGNAVSLKQLVLSDNEITGEIPREFGKLTSLSVLNLNSNRLEGKIPKELGDCSSLTTLDLGNNNLQGEIPESITGLAQLQCLVLSYNNLSGSIPSKPSSYFHETDLPDMSFLQHHGVYDLSYNRLTGPIPEELGDCLVMVEILLSNNLLSGEIPASLSRLTNLIKLDLSGNVLTGSIPEEIGHSPKLQGLNLANNRLQGNIPESFGFLASLVKLNVTKNKLDGSIPASLGNLKELTHMDLSSNELNGELPSELSRMLNLVGFYIQGNRFSGPIEDLFSSSFAWKVELINFSGNFFIGSLPRSLGNLSYLANLDLHRNQFTGEIPSELGNLMQLEYLDVSENRLSGNIPTKICGLPNLHLLNLAKNTLQGDVPRDGVCQDPSKALLSGNKGLCGRIVGSDCKINETNFLNGWGLAGIALGSMLIIFVSAFSLRRWVMRKQMKQRRDDPEAMEDSRSKGFMELYYLSGSRSKEPLSINVAMFEQPLLKVSLGEIVEGTDHFSKKNIIGDGGFGTVYKALLPSGKTVAVKKLNEAKTQGNREFMAEMETLGKVKHQNLVSLLGYCSIGEEKLLVYEYMVNGSLDHWLRNQTGILEVLDWSKRLKIAVGAARGLAFLHHGFTPHIIHRDIKASNILLDSEFEPKVADFGLARLISACETHVSTIIAGTFGYIPPEYGQSARATTKGDVYSFGVILLELVTGKEPTGPDFKESEGGNLVGWVCQKVNKSKGMDVLDPLVLSVDCKQQMLRLLQIGVRCLSDSPLNRPTMVDVLKELKEI